MLVFRFELIGKLPVMVVSWRQGSDYPIMPESAPPHQTSHSPIWWLSLHLVFGVGLSFQTFVCTFLQTQTDKSYSNSASAWQLAWHVAFSFLVLINCFRLGPLPPLAASLTNLLVVFLLSYLALKRLYFLYFVVLTFPTLITVSTLA